MSCMARRRYWKKVDFFLYFVFWRWYFFTKLFNILPPLSFSPFPPLLLSPLLSHGWERFIWVWWAGEAVRRDPAHHHPCRRQRPRHAPPPGQVFQAPLSTYCVTSSLTSMSTSWLVSWSAHSVFTIMHQRYVSEKSYYYYEWKYLYFYDYCELTVLKRSEEVCNLLK